MATSTRETRRSLRHARSAIRRTSESLDAWRALARAAPADGDTEEGVRAWIEVSRLESQRGAYLAALVALRRARALGGDTASERRRVRLRLGVALGAAALSAAFMALAVPPLDWWPLGLLGLAPLYLVVRSMDPVPALLFGWFTGLLINLYGFAWAAGLTESFGHISGPYAVGAVLVCCSYQAIVIGLWTGVSAAIVKRVDVSWLVVAPLVLAVAEATVPFVFPWYLAITVWRAWPLLQVAELGGTTAVSALVVLVSLTLAEVWRARARREPQTRQVRIAATVALAVVALGLARGGQVAWARAMARHVHVGIVQPNFGIVTANDRKLHGQEYIDLLRAQTDALGRRGVDLVVWPESSFPFLFDRQLDREFTPMHPWALRGTYQGDLLIGALTHTFGAGHDIYNSALLVSSDGRITGRYDKVRLMPFGEYVPFADRYPEWAARARERMPEASDITPGTGSAVLADGTLRIAPMICYEDILPDTRQDIGRLRPSPTLIVTLANHTWFGDSLAPRMALALATLGSVELRRDLVRATSTGVSSIGDALGRVRVEGPLVDPARRSQPPDLLDGDVALVDTLSMGPYSGPAFPYACALVLAAVSWKRRRRAA